MTLTINVIVSNPPYIPTTEIATLDRDVRDYDPQLALDGGADGLQTYREIAINIRRLVRPLWIFLEVGAGQAEAVETIFAGVGAEARHRRLDLGGHVRAVALELHR
jgi:release factor glutamine methyltransferase